MAVLIGSVLSGFTFHDLVGGPMHNTPRRRSASEEQGADSPSGQINREGRMRIYLPDGAVREMTLTEYREFLVSYRIKNIRPAAEAGHSDGGRTAGTGAEDMGSDQVTCAAMQSH